MSDYVLSREVAAALGAAAAQFSTRARHPSACCWRCDLPFADDEPAQVVGLRSVVDGRRVLRIVLSHSACGLSEMRDDPGLPERRGALAEVDLVPFVRVGPPRAGVFVDQLVEVTAASTDSVETIDLRTSMWLDDGFTLVADSADIVWGNWDPVRDWWATLTDDTLTVGHRNVTRISGPLQPPPGWVDAARTTGLLVVAGPFRFAPAATTPDTAAVAAAVRAGRVVGGRVAVR